MRSDAASARFEYEIEGVDVSSVALERSLWILVVVALVADVVTTFVGLHFGLTESNPIARGAIDGYGVAGMLVLKALAVSVALVCRELIDLQYRSIVPAGLAIPWTIAVGINLYLILTIT